MEKLALFGGVPSSETPINYGKQTIDEDDIAAVTAVLKSDYLTCGPKITEVEAKLCAITGAKYAVIVSNGTAALHLAAMAAGITQKDEVITSPITFAASANCALYCGATPVFADINPTTYNIDPEKIINCITEKTKAVVAVDFTGQAVDIDAISNICKQNKLVFIEDAAHSIYTKYNGKGVGSLADMTCFSFHPVKTVTAGEGGAVTTNNKDYYTKLLRLRAHGITRTLEDMIHPSQGNWYYEQIELGFNYRITDIQAALLSSQLDKLPAFSKRRKEIVAAYDHAFSSVPQLKIQEEIPASDTTRHLYILRLDLKKLTCTRKQFFDALIAENIYTQVHYIPVYHHPYYEALGYQKGLCPEAEYFYDEVMSLPLYASLSDKQVDCVISAVKKCVDYYKG